MKDKAGRAPRSAHVDFYDRDRGPKNRRDELLALAEQWRPMDTAPKDGRHVLLYGFQRPHDRIYIMGSFVFSGYWDTIDEAWCGTGSTFDGPFYEPTRWMPLQLPPPPAAALRAQAAMMEGEDA